MTKFTVAVSDQYRIRRITAVLLPARIRASTSHTRANTQVSIRVVGQAASVAGIQAPARGRVVGEQCRLVLIRARHGRSSAENGLRFSHRDEGVRNASRFGMDREGA
ncbi:MAG TPA: hypothetical protein VN448_01300 [Gammaproteobacteria bacterium]|jgi:hypothetical protein|nr:hypothetical protein [Gammaproteobacteria bacterium]